MGHKSGMTYLGKVMDRRCWEGCAEEIFWIVGGGIEMLLKENA
jgi:hypothetical protein